MADSKGKKVTALSICKKGYRNKRMDRGVAESKKFFNTLRNAVIEEMETRGFCELIDSLMERNGGIDIIVFAVFADIANGYANKKMINLERDERYIFYVPYALDYNRRPIKWTDCECYGKIICSTNDVSEEIRIARKILRDAHTKGINEKKSSFYERENLVNNQAESILEEAKRTAEHIVADARHEADQIKESARGTAKKLTDKYLVEEQKQYKAKLNEEMSKIANEYLESTKRAVTIHTEMCDATNAFQVKWIQTLDNALSQMSSVKEEFYSHIHDWQLSLFSSEIKPLAERYLELYRILNIDKLIREEILLRNLEVEVSETFIFRLQKLNETLDTFLRRFEISLNRLDLYVYYPKAGDEFDDIWHISDEDEEAYGKQIIECVVPGIAKKVADNYGDDVLIQAVVKVSA